MDIRPHVTDKNADITPAILIVLVIVQFPFMLTNELYRASQRMSRGSERSLEGVHSERL
jgi:hypothetical protein